MTTASQIITALGGNPNTGLCKCPSHDDSRPSLSVREVNGKVLLKCFADCSNEKVISALRSRGLWGSASRSGPKSATDTKREKSPVQDEAFDSEEVHWKFLRAAAQAKEQPVAYLKSRRIGLRPNTLKFVSRKECSRIAGKNFPAMVAPIVSANGDVQGSHVTYLTRDGAQNCEGENGKLRRMYGKLGYGVVRLSPIDPQKPLIIAEGIETTLAAMELCDLPGIAALSATNLKVITPPPCASVIIAGDNDNAGKEAAEVLARKLSGEGHKVRVAFPPNGNDWNDAIRGDCNREKLRKELLGANEYVPTGTSSLALTMRQVMEIEVPPRHYLLKPWLRERSSGMIHAPRGAGKTWLAIAVAYAVASGRSLLGWDVPHRTKVLYVDAELDISVVQERLQMLGEPDENLSFLSFDHLFRQGQVLPDLGRPEGREFFDRVFDKEQPGLVVFDSLTYLCGVAENEAEAWHPIAEWIIKHRRLGRTILFIHHQGRSGKARGTTKREDGLEVSISLKPTDDLAAFDGSAMELTFDKHREFFGLDAAPRIVRWTTSSGKLTWETNNLPPDKKTLVKEMLREGKKGVEIANELNVSKGYVSQIKREMSDSESLLAKSQPE